MLKSIAVAAIAVASLSLTSAAFANVNVNVNVSSWKKHHHHHVAQLDAPRHPKAAKVYYSGAYAHVARDNGATHIWAYPGVSVFVGSGGGVSVNIGF